MPAQDQDRSPARRQQLPDRSSTSQSISREALTAGHLLNTHKGSSSRLHKAHAVGQGRHIHNRVPSHGKGLNKLSKLGPGNGNEDINNTRHSARSPSTSPVTLSNIPNSSTLSLIRPSSKGSIKRNTSHPALSRNGSAAKVGNQPKSEKAQTKKNVLTKGTNDAPIRGLAQFEVGDDTQDDEWTEDSSSQSPATNRTHSRPKTPVTPNPKELPTPDEPPERLSPRLPDSPPASPPFEASATSEAKVGATARNHYNRDDSYSHPPDAQAVTSRLLNRSGPGPIIPQTSEISANVTPHHIGSPSLSQSQASTVLNEPSLPADGISRFLSTTNSTLGSGTPSSVSQSQQTLGKIYRIHQHLSPPTDPNSESTPTGDTRRVKSAADLTHGPLVNDESLTPPTSPPADDHLRSRQRGSRIKHPYHPSPFESARGANPAAGKSYTQLKLNLDREAVSRDPPISSHPILSNNGSMLNMAGTISSNASDMQKRIRRQYDLARKDVNHSRKYYPDIVTSKIPERAVKRHQLEKENQRKIKDKGRKDTGSGGGSSLESTQSAKQLSVDAESVHSRGRVRFEVGSRSFEDHRNDQGVNGEEGPEHDDLEGLLRRIWIAPEPRVEEAGE